MSTGGIAPLLQAPAHPARPLARANFIAVARHGFGDAENTYAHSMAWFKGRLYVGVTRNALCGGRTYDRTRHYHIYPVKVPEIPWDLDWRAQIWRFDPSTCNWRMVHISPMVMGARGFEIPRHYGFRERFGVGLGEKYSGELRRLCQLGLIEWV